VPIEVDLITPAGQILKGAPADLTTLPGQDGIFGVEEGHINLFGILKPGEVRLMKDRGRSEERFAISGGLVKVSSDHVLILAEAAEGSADIDVERAKRALERATERLKSAGREEIDVERAKWALERAKTRIEIAAKKSSAF